jgi:hypothetical protein
MRVSQPRLPVHRPTCASGTNSEMSCDVRPLRWMTGKAMCTMQRHSPQGNNGSLPQRVEPRDLNRRYLERGVPDFRILTVRRSRSTTFSPKRMWYYWTNPAVLASAERPICEMPIAGACLRRG